MQCSTRSQDTPSPLPQAFEAYIRENFFSELSKGQAFVGMPPAFFEKVVVPRFSNGIQDGIFTPTDDPSKPQGYYVPADEAFLPKPKGSRPFFAVVLQNGPFMVNPQPALANNMNLTQRVESLLEIMETGRSTTSDLALYTTAYMGGLIKVRRRPAVTPARAPARRPGRRRSSAHISRGPRPTAPSAVGGQRHADPHDDHPEPDARRGQQRHGPRPAAHHGRFRLLLHVARFD